PVNGHRNPENTLAASKFQAKIKPGFVTSIRASHCQKATSRNRIFFTKSCEWDLALFGFRWNPRAGAARELRFPGNEGWARRRVGSGRVAFRRGSAESGPGSFR